MKPMQGIRILDFTQFFSGPLCTMMLGDFGAEIIKLENPAVCGDNTRYTLEMWHGTNSNYATKNRNKKSMLMDLNDERQRTLFLKMVETADVLVENFKPGTMERFGLSYEKLHAVNPRLVYTSISGFGQTGPLRDHPAVDGVIQAMSGFMSLTGINDIPTQAGPPIADAIGGLVGAIGTLCALLDARSTGMGHHVDVSMLDSMLITYEDIITRYNMTGKIPKLIGNRHANLAPFQPFKFQENKELYICITTDDQWKRFCSLLGHEEWSCDPRFSTIAERSKHRDSVVGMIQNVVRNMDAAEFMTEMQKENLICGEIYNIKQVVEHPQIKARNMLKHVKYPSGEIYTVPGCPVKISGMDDDCEAVADPLGYHTIEIASQYISEEEAHEIYDKVLEQTLQRAKNRYRE